MEPSLPVIINEDQKGFLSKRRIACNIRKILDLMQFAKDNRLKALLIELDFKKCFDMIAMEAITGALEYFEFGTFIKDWVKILYTDYGVKVQNNGKFSEKIKVERSVHQGGVCSTAIFLLAAELLAIDLRSNPNIKAITFRGHNNLMGQYADDTDLTPLAEQKTIDEIFGTLEKFRLKSGFTINYDKTKILRLGALKNTDFELITQKTVSWTSEPVNVLGVWVDDNESSLYQLNYADILEKSKKIVDLWEHRNLSLV